LQKNKQSTPLNYRVKYYSIYGCYEINPSRFISYSLLFTFILIIDTIRNLSYPDKQLQKNPENKYFIL